MERAGARVVPAFYDAPGFLDAFAAVARPVLAEATPDHVLFTFHGLPERQIEERPDRRALPRSETCCDTLAHANRCYRAQCYATARALAQRLGLADAHRSCFQSRLGRTPWIKPYTDVRPRRAGRGRA